MRLGKSLHILSLSIEDRKHYRPLTYGTPHFEQLLSYVGTCVIGGYIDWTVLPRQRILKRVTHVEQAPCYNNIVVKSHVKTDLEEKKGFMNDLRNKLSIFTQQVLLRYRIQCADLYNVQTEIFSRSELCFPSGETKIGLFRI